ncbi:hypothetical protein L6452_26095 [Arctium lappa]|uniref:Uncharacterized protein n=1 Tax=Arctium lappa TaxID=4217 RepID=A0ACB9ACR4_ARCLA|nr:hypothetical protein L6452_26095 [Arctium lappa]
MNTKLNSESLPVLQLVSWVDVECRDHVKLFLLEELHRRLTRRTCCIRFHCHLPSFCGDFSSFQIYGSTIVMVTKMVF